MDAENQGLIQRLAAEHGSDNLVVVLGAADIEGVEITAETLTLGDPSFAGPLAGVQLGLQVYHILESDIRKLIPENIYEEKLGVAALAFDVEGIEKSLAALRARSAEVRHSQKPS